MKTLNILTAFCLLYLQAFSQEKELELFRKELVTFVNYDNGKPGSLPKTEQNTISLKKNMEDAFLQFVMHKDSKDLETLRKKGQTDGKNMYWFTNPSYSFSEPRRDMKLKTKENNIDYQITFDGLYDYQLSHFVSMYIQPFTVNNDNYAVYYYKLNGAGKYFMKDTRKNKIVFSSGAFTNSNPIRLFTKLEGDHYLILEDMGNNGQRAMVLKKSKDAFEVVDAFKGKAFATPGDRKVKTFVEKRTYLLLASSKTIISHLSMFEARQNLLSFDEASKSITYSTSHDRSKMITAKWENNMFDIDDYYVGESFTDEPMPYPD